MRVSDGNLGLTAMVIVKWSQGRRIDWHRIALGRLTQNAFPESFIRQFRDACLNETLFTSLRLSHKLISVCARSSVH